jgi:hypothetical protein
MMSKDVLGLIAVVISTVAGANYVISIIRNKTKPHAFTWIVWCIIASIVFIAQWNGGAGAGSWSTGESSLLCLVVSGLSFFKGERNITKTDWLAFSSALFIIPFWYVTKNSLLAVVLATAIDACAYYPTFRKAWIKPYEEDFVLYALDVVMRLFTLAAMGEYTTTTLLYPAFCMVSNGLIVVMILMRRRIQKI